MIEARTGPERGYFPVIMAIIELEVQATVDPRSGSRASQNKERIHCYKCREYNHFARDYPTSREKRRLNSFNKY